MPAAGRPLSPSPFHGLPRSWPAAYQSLATGGREDRGCARRLRRHDEGGYRLELPGDRDGAVLSGLWIGVRIGQMPQSVVETGRIDALVLFEILAPMPDGQKDLLPGLIAAEQPGDISIGLQRHAQMRLREIQIADENRIADQ